ncbi:MAG: hypothetical protein ACXWQO_04605 [Bdellovibrionota bacterium]
MKKIIMIGALVLSSATAFASSGSKQFEGYSQSGVLADVLVNLSNVKKETSGKVTNPVMNIEIDYVKCKEHAIGGANPLPVRDVQCVVQQGSKKITLDALSSMALKDALTHLGVNEDGAAGTSTTEASAITCNLDSNSELSRTPNCSVTAEWQE